MDLTAKIYAFLKELENFSYELSVLDHVWNILYPDAKNTWHHLHVNKYKKAYYISHISGNAGLLEVVPNKNIMIMENMGNNSIPIEENNQKAAVWKPIIASARGWLKIVARDWIKANKKVQLEYPLRNRYGIVHNSIIRASLPDIYHLDKELGIANTRRLVGLVEEGYFMRSENTELLSMTAADFFEYCRIAYIAAARKEDAVDKSLSGRDMYKKYADGRHEGLLEIDPDSEQEFADWIDGKHPKRGMGGHPWEIKRGGNTTHIDLYVMRPSQYSNKGFKVELRGESIGRMVETLRMFLAIHKSGRPISIANPEAVRKRLLALDSIGIIPHYISTHRANQHFSRGNEVFDVLHYDDLGRYKRRIIPFITWEPLPVLKPSDV